MGNKVWDKESTFGVWFLGTDTWKNYVLKLALDDLMIIRGADAKQSYDYIVDIGCGHGISLQMLDEYLQPQKITGIDVDPRVLAQAEMQAKTCQCEIEVKNMTATAIDIEDNQVDMVFCHQSLHHIADQTTALSECLRILKPGGHLWLSESCRRFIYSLPVRLLFKHPMEMQKSSAEYIELVKQVGFTVADQQISNPYLWWSRPDIGILEYFGRAVPRNPEPTLVNLIASK